MRRCRDWATQLDREREGLEEGKPFEEVRTEADATVQQIIEVLQTRAESV